MGAALSIIIILTISALIVRLATVALRITGLNESVALFQALTAFTGTGYSTSESEVVVNYPVRRRIAMILMVVGNLGFVSVLATLVASFVHADGDLKAVLIQLAWLILAVVVLWIIVLNKTVDRAMCSILNKIILATTELGKRKYQRLLQVGNGYSVCEHIITDSMLTSEMVIKKELFDKLGLIVMATHSIAGIQNEEITSKSCLTNEDTIILYGPDNCHEQLTNHIKQ